MKKIILLGILLLIVIPFPTLALEFDNVKSYDEDTKTISIINAFNLPLLRSTLAEYTLDYNTDYCLINCEARGTAKIYSEDKLFSDMNFYDTKEREKDINYNIFIQDTKTVIEEHNNYTKICKASKEENNTCSTVLVNKYNTTRQENYWKEYKGEDLKPDTYDWKIEATKQKTDSIDWVGTAFGKEFNEWAWWNADWGYKQQININGSVENLVNYQVRLMVENNSNMQADFEDIRFLNSSETGELDYWLEYKHDSHNATFWVEVDTVLANATTSIYMYYNNTGASSTSNGGDTFVYYDGFEDGIGSWTGDGEISSTQARVGTYSAKITDKNSHFTDDFTDGHYKTHFYILDDGTTTIQWAGLYDSGTGYLLFSFADGTQIQFLPAGTETLTRSNGWHDIAQETSGTIITKFIKEIDSETILANNTQSGNAEVTTWNFYDNTGTDFYIDDLFLADISIVESSYSFGVEESGITAPIVSLNTPINNTVTDDITVDFNCSASDDTEVTNILLYIDGALESNTSFSGTNDTSINEDVVLTDGSYNWTCVAYDDGDLEGTTDTWFLTIDTINPVITISYPVDSEIYSTATTNISYIITETNADTCYFNATNSTGTKQYILDCALTNYTITASYGENTYLLWVNDTAGNTNTTSITFNVDDVFPLITIDYPVDSVVYNEDTLTINTTASDDNLDSCWYTVSGFGYANNATFTCNTNPSVTSVEGSNTYIVWANDTAGNTNTTNSTFYIDTTVPIMNLYFPANNSNITTATLPFNISFSYNVSDAYLDSCWYNTTDNATITYFTCNSTEYPVFLSEGSKTIYYHANDSLGLQNDASMLFNILYHTYEQEQSATSVIEGSSVTFNLTVNNTNIGVTTAYLYYNNTFYSPTTRSASTNQYFFSKSIDIPTGDGSTGGIVQNWLWNYSIPSIVTNYQTTSTNLTVYSLEIDDCTIYNTTILNFTLLDEALNNWINLTTSNGTTLVEYEVNLTDTISGSSTVLLGTIHNSSNFQVCVPDYLFNYSSYYLYLTAGYNADDYVNEFYHIDGETLISSNIPVDVEMRDLLLADSTSFLFSYKDENDLLKPFVVVEVLRNYIGDGVYRIAEREITDDNGETNIHLVEEDVIYKFNIYENEVLIYSSDNYKAFCDASPCSLDLFEGTGIDVFNTDLDNVAGTYSWTIEESTRTVEVDFTLDKSETMNLTIYALNHTSSDSTAIDSDSITGTSGTLSVTVPLTLGNDTFYSVLRKSNSTDTNTWVASTWINMNQNMIGFLGNDAWLYSGLIVMVFAFIGIASGSGVIIFTLLALLVIGFLFIIDTAVGITLLFIAGLLLLWKLSRRRG